MNGAHTLARATQSVCIGPVNVCGQQAHNLGDNAQRVLAALETVPSYRRLDLMRVCHMTRAHVAEALDELMRERLVQSFSGRTRYAARTRICPPVETHTGSTPLADDTHQHPVGMCGRSLSALAHTGASP